MSLINREVVEQRKTELYEFICQYTVRYLDFILEVLRFSIIQKQTGIQDSSHILNIVRNMQKIGISKEEQFYEELKNFVAYEWQSVEEFPCQLTQLFSKFGMINKEYDIYMRMYHLLQKYDFLDENCCEVGSGEYPRLSEIVYPEIKKNNHNLVIYEPNILISKLDNITIIKDEFTKKTDLSNIGTIFAIYPCEATPAIAEKAFEEDKNLILVCCGCDHSDDKYKTWGLPYWSRSLCLDFMIQYGDDAIVENWPSQYGIPYPILIRESSKHKMKKLYKGNEF